MQLEFSVKAGNHRAEVFEAILSKAGMASFEWSDENLRVNSFADISEDDREEITQLIKRRERELKL